MKTFRKGQIIKVTDLITSRNGGLIIGLTGVISEKETQRATGSEFIYTVIIYDQQGIKIGTWRMAAKELTLVHNIDITTRREIKPGLDLFLD